MPVTTSYVRNTWYPLTWSRDVGRVLRQRRILGEDLVVYRTESGKPAALRETCPHRLAPLSAGHLRGDAVECGYHGMTFGPDGRCTRIPGQKLIPANARVRAYPVAERMGLVWIWMGEPALADATKIYNLPRYGLAGWRAVEGDALRIDANYLNLADNLCDPAHVSFVHTTTLGNAASEDIPVEHKSTDSGVLVWRWIPNAPPIPLFAKYGNFKGNVDRWHYYDYIAPCIAIIDFGSADAGATVDLDDRSKGMQIFACHFLTPVDDHSCIDHWLFVRNFALDDAEVDERMRDDFRVAFNEDKDILEKIESVERAGTDIKRIRLGIDAAPVRMRRHVEQLIEQETRGPTVSVA
jgi:phenylpropionate dioxygenase-like ring-hydroxylating dioxygenase large terminal subunit